MKAGTTLGFQYEGATCKVVIEDPEWARLCNLYSRNRGKGEASRVLGLACAWADSVNMNLELRAGPYSSKPGLTKDELVTFYKKFGFRLIPVTDLDDPRKYGYCLERFYKRVVRI